MMELPSICKVNAFQRKEFKSTEQIDFVHRTNMNQRSEQREKWTKPQCPSFVEKAEPYLTSIKQSHSSVANDHCSRQPRTQIGRFA